MTDQIILLTDAKTLQNYINRNSKANLKVDGVLGPRTFKAAEEALRNLHDSGKFQFAVSLLRTDLPTQRDITALEQTLLAQFLPAGESLGLIDGIAGPRTTYALEFYQNRIRDLPTPPQLSTRLGNKPDFGTQANIRKTFGEPANESNLVRVSTPYPLFLDWALSTKVNAFQCHRKVKDSIQLAMEKILGHYGPDGIVELNLNHFGGCYNPRKMRGGSSWSGLALGLHADGCR